MEGIEDSASASLDPNETLMSQLYKFFSSPVNAALTAFCGYLIYKLIRGNSDDRKLSHAVSSTCDTLLILIPYATHVCCVQNKQ